jgi:UDP-GlcNAc3NAcA epimerase
MKIITIVGARPQFIKAAALSREFAKYENIQELIIHTGQHFDRNMSDVFFEEMEIPNPNFQLNIHGFSHGAMTGHMLEQIEKILLSERPDYVLVFGDTNSTLAGALAASKLHIKVIHVEAGLRSFNMKMPEEINRILTDRISSILFCPTENALNNLRLEGFENFGCEMINCGDIMQDAAQYYSIKSGEKSKILDTHNINANDFILATIHRAENTDDSSRLFRIIKALNKINNEIKVVLPIHPRTAAIIKSLNVDVKFLMIEPVGYFDMLQLIKNSNLVCTDSGGLQKEAYFFNKFCITCRDQTEWIELVENEYNILTGADEDNIYQAYQKFSNSTFLKKTELFGGGVAAKSIVRYLTNNYIK